MGNHSGSSNVSHRSSIISSHSSVNLEHNSVVSSKNTGRCNNVNKKKTNYRKDVMTSTDS